MKWRQSMSSYHFLQFNYMIFIYSFSKFFISHPQFQPRLQGYLPKENMGSVLLLISKCYVGKANICELRKETLNLLLVLILIAL